MSMYEQLKALVGKNVNISYGEYGDEAKVYLSKVSVDEIIISYSSQCTLRIDINIVKFVEACDE